MRTGTYKPTGEKRIVVVSGVGGSKCIKVDVYKKHISLLRRILCIK